MSRLSEAKEQYAAFGADVDAAFAALAEVPVSIHCWQGDDVAGFEDTGEGLSGGIQATGDHPGRARTPGELMADFEKALSLIPGKKRLNLHASYAIRAAGDGRGRDEVAPEHFAPWTEYAKKNGIGLDFNPTFFSHPMVKGGLTLSSPDDEVRAYWVRHGRACRRVAAYFAEALAGEVLCNVWVPDGLKDVPADRLGPRQRLAESLDAIFEEALPGVIDSVESKVFGIGVESYTVGSSEFYTAYAAQRGGVYPLMDSGHYHPMEFVSDKISSMLAFFERLPLHVTRPVRWDSDHVVLFEDEVKEIAKELVRCGGLHRVMLGLDFFDASLNRVAAWAVGARSMQKALLYALLWPHEALRKLQDEGDFTRLMAMQEAGKLLPFGDVWAAWCEAQGVPGEAEWYREAEAYEREVLMKRG